MVKPFCDVCGEKALDEAWVRPKLNQVAVAYSFVVLELVYQDRGEVELDVWLRHKRNEKRLDLCAIHLRDIFLRLAEVVSEIEQVGQIGQVGPA